MLNIIIYGLDQFVVSDLSRDYLAELANLCEMEKDDINFIAPSSMICHDGIDQTSWRVFVEVKAPQKIHVLKDQISDFIVSMLKNVAVHVEILFDFYPIDHRTISINKDYPLYIASDNSVFIEEDECVDHEHLEEGEEDGQIFTGDIFKDFDK